MHASAPCRPQDPPSARYEKNLSVELAVDAAHQATASGATPSYSRARAVARERSSRRPRTTCGPNSDAKLAASSSETS